MSLLQDINELEGEMLIPNSGDRMIYDMSQVFNKYEIEVGFNIVNNQIKAVIRRFGEIIWSRWGNTITSDILQDRSFLKYPLIKYHREIVKQTASLFKTYNIEFRGNNGGYIRIYDLNSDKILYSIDSWMLTNLELRLHKQFFRSNTINLENYNINIHPKQLSKLDRHLFKNMYWWKTTLKNNSTMQIIGYILLPVLALIFTLFITLFPFVI